MQASEAAPSAAAIAKASSASPAATPSAHTGRHAARGDRTGPLHGVQPVGGGVADVVHQVRGARGGAVGDERCDRLEPAPAVAELRREHDPREEQEVLRPLPRPQGGDDCCRSRPGAREADGRGERFRHAVMLFRRSRPASCDAPRSSTGRAARGGSGCRFPVPCRARSGRRAHRRARGRSATRGRFPAYPSRRTG